MKKMLMLFVLLFSLAVNAKGDTGVANVDFGTSYDKVSCPRQSVQTPVTEVSGIMNIWRIMI